MTKIILNSVLDLKNWKKDTRKSINFVPTLGNLHRGHQRLIETAKNYYKNLTLVSIFLNPLQFNNKNDLITYPKTIEKDIKKGFSAGADAIFIPSFKDIYPEPNNIKKIRASRDLTSALCGLTREGHFDGVCTVVFQLLNLIEPKTIFLGEKDWQQLLILKEMIIDLKLNVKVKSVRTHRDFDGVPFSSRNSLLSSSERKTLKVFSEILLNAKNSFFNGKKINLISIIKEIKANNLEVEYLEHLDAYNFKEPSSNITILAGAVLFGNKRFIDHIFLMKRKPIIAIDGPAGSGKSTITKLIANKLNFIYLDTGAMYRALSWFLIHKEANYENTIELENILKNVQIVFKTNSENNQDVYINEYCVTKEIRSQDVSLLVSKIASINQVREFLVSEQRKIGDFGGIIAEGRDIGTHVFPNAELKIFLTASINERAKRRKLELEEKGNLNIDFDTIKNQIRDRDYDDSNRKISPLKKAKDALEIVTDGYSIDEIVDKISEIYSDRIPKELQS